MGRLRRRLNRTDGITGRPKSRALFQQQLPGNPTWFRHYTRYDAPKEFRPIVQVRNAMCSALIFAFFGRRSLWRAWGAIALLFFSSATVLAQDKTEPINWTPGGKLKWDQYKGGKPSDGLDAYTHVDLDVKWTCKNGKYTLEVRAQMNPDESQVDPAKQSAELLAHEQIHFDIGEQYARKLKEELEALLKDRCKCNMSAKDLEKLGADIDAANKKATDAMKETQGKYDTETSHGNQVTKEEKATQKKWATDTAKALGQPAPAETPTKGAEKPKESGNKQPADCKKCQEAEKEKQKKLTALDNKLKALQTEELRLISNQSKAESELKQAKADVETADGAVKAATPKTKVAADTKLNNAKTKQQGIEKKISEAEGKLKGIREQEKNVQKEMDELESQKNKCPDHCSASPGDSALALPSDSPVAGVNACPQTAMLFPGTPETLNYPESYTVSFTSDGGKFCTYDDSTSVPAPIFFAGDQGNVVPPDPVGSPQTSQTPQTPQTPQSPTAQTPSEAPPTAVTERTPPQAPKTPPPESPKTPRTEQPKSPPDTPTTVTIDAPPPDRPTEIPDTVFVKATEAVLEGQPQGQPIQGQVVKLLPPEKPDLPSDGRTKTAQDTGFDRPPVQCTTEANGECRADVPQNERPFYNLPSRGAATKQSYRIDVSIRNVSGGLIETTGRNGRPDLASTPRGTAVNGDEFRVGNRTFMRVRGYADAGAALSLRERFGGTDSKYEEDICRDKQPGPPLGMQPSSFEALDHHLLGRLIRLDPALRARRIAR
jgi:hypothetical protein